MRETFVCALLFQFNRKGVSVDKNLLYVPAGNQQLLNKNKSVKFAS